TLYPGILARPPVPAPLTTRNRPSWTASMVDCFIFTIDCGGGGGTGFNPSPSSTAFSTCGVNRVPPFPTTIIITASEIGVTLTAPWPIDTEIVSPAYHFSFISRCFHSVEGTSP